MASKISGFDELGRTLDTLGDVGKKIGMASLRKGMRHTLQQMKEDAPKNTGDGAKALKVTSSKQYKSGDCVLRAGINSSNWEKCKGIYFQNYGYTNHINGEKVAKHTGWVNQAFNKSANKAEREIIAHAQSEIKKIIGG